MKITIKSLLAVAIIVPCLFAIPLLTGCNLFGKNAAPPTAFDRKAFDVVTNIVYKVENVTNHIPIYDTNYQVEVITITNEQNVVKQVFATNYIPIINFSNQVVTVTNRVEQYDYSHPSQTSQTVSSIAGTLSNMGMPGIGSLVSMGIIGALGIYGKLRGNKTSAALAQGIETARSVLLETPQGQELDAKYKAWLIQNQSAAGVLNAVTSILNKSGNTPAGEAMADAAAKEIVKGVIPGKT